MLSTIIYRSHLCDDVPVKSLAALARNANQINTSMGVTGILLFNGTHFFQLLEGPEEAVSTVYRNICHDPRHHNLVELMCDVTPSRRFGNAGMELFNLREHDRDGVLQAVLDKGTTQYQLTYDDRALKLLRTFVEAVETENYFEIPSADGWEFISQAQDNALSPELSASGVGFAFQPVVDPLAQKIISYEALIRCADGRSPEQYFASMNHAERLRADLDSKSQAFTFAAKLLSPGVTLSINLFPAVLTELPGSVECLLNAILSAGLVPEQVTVEITENAGVTPPAEFDVAVRQLRAAGIRLAIDGFGTGNSGLMMLTHFQPDIIKIDRNIISNVHKSGPKQAVILAIIRCCASLEISVVAEGVEEPQEWMWLESAGVSSFQGFLFAIPGSTGVPAVAWPELK
ncbi:diguanylate phosphodiesterase [Erwinia billingiae]|uniref:diguanylate phosphodiesterase n=1 Tax=Erwinia billingiae TaxID=182337 RepID=UPI00224667F9|nr:diguanylate phosphodiesterase [Erwinia billingiae]MCX0498268.1 diguanylate phosphodiesterase [Erwinia billingiae]